MFRNYTYSIFIIPRRKPHCQTEHKNPTHLVWIAATLPVVEGSFLHTPPSIKLASAGRMAEEIDRVIVDVEAVLGVLKRANLILDARAHDELRKVLAFVRGQQKFDARIVDLVPHLLAYFSNEPPQKAPKA
jgi:hypothetical protein